MISPHIAAHPAYYADHAADILEAASLYFAQGLAVVAYTDPDGGGAKPGKSPLRNLDESAEDRRAVCRNIGEVGLYLARVPGMNLAVLGVIQLDADSLEAQVKLRELGVSRELSAWYLRSRRGWKAFFKPPTGFALPNRTKGGCVCPEPRDPSFKVRRAYCPGWRHSDDPLGKLELDFLNAATPSIVPPSVHPSGWHYLWAEGHSPAEIPFAELCEPPVLALEFWKNLCNTRRAIARGSLQQSKGFYEQLRAHLEGRTRHGRLPAPNAAGWIGAIPCPFPQNHKHGDEKSPGFTFNERLGVWKCHASCGSGSLKALAEQLGLDVTTTERRPRGRRLVRSPRRTPVTP